MKIKVDNLVKYLVYFLTYGGLIIVVISVLFVVFQPLAMYSEKLEETFDFLRLKKIM